MTTADLIVSLYHGAVASVRADLAAYQEGYKALDGAPGPMARRVRAQLDGEIVRRKIALADVQAATGKYIRSTLAQAFA